MDEVRIDAIFPLALLLSVKAHDRPSEVLEDEDLTASLPRRLGLSGVVETQISRYEQDRKRGRGVPLDEVLNLLRLVLRRPDADAILRETGHRIARDAFRRVPALYLRLVGLLPGGTARAGRRAALRTLRRAAYPGNVEVAGRPFVVRIENAPASAMEPPAFACTLYSGIIEETVRLYTGADADVTHSRCSAAGEKWCEWRLPD